MLPGKLLSSLFGRSRKFADRPQCRDRMGGEDYRMTYVCWPQEACFIGQDRHRVCYDELSHPQWSADIAYIVSTESNFRV